MEVKNLTFFIIALILIVSANAILYIENYSDTFHDGTSIKLWTYVGGENNTVNLTLPSKSIAKNITITISQLDNQNNVTVWVGNELVIIP